MNSDSGLSTVQFALLTAIATIVLILAVVNTLAFNANVEQRQLFSNRQQHIAQSQKLRQVGTELVKTMAQVAATKQDQPLTDLLAGFGITFKSKTAEPADE